MSADDRRLHGLDLARYLALAGMVLVNFRLAMAGPAEEAGWLAGFFHLLEGKASATFVTLAGLGLVLATQRQQWWPASVQTLRRALFLLVLGLLNLTVFPADILHYYAVYFALAVVRLRASPQVLLASIVGLAACSFWALLHWDYSQGWNWQTLEYAGLWQWPGAARNLLFNGFHPLLPWLCFFLLGMLLARLQLSQPRVQRALLVLGVLLIGAGQGVQHLAQERHGRRGWVRNRCRRAPPTCLPVRARPAVSSPPACGWHGYIRATGWSRSRRQGA